MNNPFQQETPPAREAYVHAASHAYDIEMAHRTLERAATFILPHLRPGLRLLDIGCGPGSITLGLAAAVAPGTVVGVDLRPEMVEQARALATARGVANVRFEVASAYALPFPDTSFDVAFAHTLLLHLREPVAALCEVRRVLHPGGVVGLRDPDLASMCIFPPPALWDEYVALRERVRRHNGGDPAMGRKHRHLLLAAGFARAEASASAENYGSLAATRHYAAVLRAMMPGFAETALAEGWADQPMLDAMLAGIDAWAEQPDACYADIWCETIGWVAGN